MIVARSPLRISLGGGGTDLPSYYREHGGFVVAAAIAKYVYTTVHSTFNHRLILKYSQLEDVASVNDVKHPIIREALKLVAPDHAQLEIASMADVPAGTGLGSSGSFTTALLLGLHNYYHSFISPLDLAEQACHIEIDRLGEPIGKQDQYIAAFGGIAAFTYHPDGRVDAQRLRLSQSTLFGLEEGLVLFFTGFTRSAREILSDQDTRSKQQDNSMVENLHRIKELGQCTRSLLERGDLGGYASLLDSHWKHKRARSPGITNPEIDEYYEFALKNGALGGKLVGAGGGGFLLLFAEDRSRLRAAMAKAGLQEIQVNFDFAGTSLVARS
jgi:D-glycero-alpha-D-manno-heptose-7-phosphate kinase